MDTAVKERLEPALRSPRPDVLAGRGLGSPSSQADPPAAPKSLGARLRRRQRKVLRGVWTALGLSPELVVAGRGVSLSRAAREVTRHGMIETLTPTVTVRDGDERYAFRCRDHAEFVRVYTMLEREEGTVEWLQEELRPDDVLYDIGANIGAFTVLGATRVPRGAVYAFEPHLANAASLLANVGLNGLEEVVRVLSCPLSAQDGAFAFEYEDLQAGTAFSHLAARADRAGRPGAINTELKLATTIDRLLAEGAIHPADVVKLDVDGLELEVLRGMRAYLLGPDRPRVIQVEVNPDGRAALRGFLGACGFELDSRHLSAGAAKRVAAGEDARALPCNGIFRAS